LDAALGIGGLPRGRIVEIFGPASCGKTALALQIIAHGQRQGAAAAWIDAERAFDPAFASQLEVDVARLPIARPATAEQALEMARRFASSGAVDLIILDSAAALVPELEMAAGIGNAGGGLLGRILSSELRRLSRPIARSGACLVLLNQTRARLGSPGEPETSAGGHAIKLYASVRIVLAASGHTVRFRVLKNKLRAPFTGGCFEWRRGAGFREPR
jgi:recombination protein RecA